MQELPNRELLCCARDLLSSIMEHLSIFQEEREKHAESACRDREIALDKRQ